MRARSSTGELDDGVVAAWLTAVAAGDADALAVLYGQTSGRLMAVLVHLLRRRELAEEVLHDVYLRVWHRARTFDPARGSAMGWLVAIARNSALDHYPPPPARGCRDRRPGDRRGKLRTLSTSPPHRKARRALQHCLDLLEPEPRRCVILAYQSAVTPMRRWRAVWTARSGR